MMKQYVLVAVLLVIISSDDCLACFDKNYKHSLALKTGDKFFTACHCEKNGYSAKNLVWLDPHGKVLEPLGDNEENQEYITNIPGNTKPLEIVTPNPDTAKRSDKIYAQLITGGVGLYIENASNELAGTYTCKTNFEGNEYIIAYDIIVQEDLYFSESSLDSQFIVGGKDSLIKCVARGPNIFVSWYKIQDGNEIEIYDNDKYQLSASEGLVIRNAVESDKGEYICKAVNAVLGIPKEKNIKVEFTIEPTISDLKPSPSTTVIAGSSLSIECLAEGKPHPEYFWDKISEIESNEATGPQVRNDSWTQSVNTISFKNIQREDNGTYECIATNKAGKDKQNITINVLVPPVITLFENKTVVEGSVTQIICKASGVPRPEVEIVYAAYDTDLVNLSSVFFHKVETDDEMTLILSFMNVSRYHGQEYYCNASNEAGETEKEMHMEVMYKPQFNETSERVWGWSGKAITLNCAHESNPEATVVWRYQGENVTTAEQVAVNKDIIEMNNDSDYLNILVNENTKYGYYECTAQNAYGASTKQVLLQKASPPGIVQNVTDINGTASSVTFYIEEPEPVEGPPVVGYVAQYDEMDTFYTSQAHLNRTWALNSKYIIQKLKPNTIYLIHFAAVSEGGLFGNWSTVYQYGTPATSVPEPPVWDENNNAPGNQVLRWKDSESNGATIDHYIIEYCPYSDFVTNFTLCNSERIERITAFPLNKLEPIKTYKFTLKAHNRHGYSETVELILTTPDLTEKLPLLSSGGIIGISVIVVFLCLLLLDLLLLCWRRQGIIASCFFKKNKKKRDDNLLSRDKKGLLKNKTETKPGDSLDKPKNGHREYEYNKTTGAITGKHSSV